MRSTIHRRHFLKGAVAGGALGASALLHRRGEAAEGDPRFLIVLAASGGASIIDSVMAIRQSESNNAGALNTFPDQLVQGFEGSPFRAIDLSNDRLGAIPFPYTANQSNFVRKNKDDMMAVTLTGTSVNHGIAQKRSLTGNEAWRGRTLQEAVASTYGEGFAIPNVNMAIGTNYIDRGTDLSLPGFAYGEPVAQPALWPLALDGSRGLKAPRRDLIAMMRALRDEKLDAESRFQRIFKQSPRLKTWLEQRRLARRLEMEELIKTLMLFPNSDRYPLTQHGLEESPLARAVREKFPAFESDPLEAQAALAFLLLKNGVSVSVTIAPNFSAVLDQDANIDLLGLGEGDGRTDNLVRNPPIAFDFSHQSHRDTQALMWSRIYRIADGLIDLLKATEFRAGESMWNRSMIYIATEFGRTKTRSSFSEQFGTAHDLNNGVLVISPLVNGGKILGGVDPNTALTYGFDPEDPSGVPTPGRNMSEREIYSGLVHALGIATGGELPNMRAMRRRA